MLKVVRAGTREAAALLVRTTAMAGDVDAKVADIIAAVRARGDDAVAEYTRTFDGRAPRDGSYELATAAWDAAASRVAPQVRAALELAARRIRAFHDLQREPEVDTTLEGVRLELRHTPLARVGLYVPGGTARYPSSVLMTAIPAKVAGVGELIMVTPGASPETLLAARIAGVDRVFELGGAQAVAALACGTHTVPRVDKIVGPGNAWVASAKRQVFGEVDIDAIAGPSEVLIIADGTARAAWVAADLIAQAEHDREARAVMVTTSEALVAAVGGELARQLATLPRRAIAEHALAHHGAAVIADSPAAAVAFANQFAPEHLELHLANAREVAAQCTTAGAIFVGEFASEAAGDYLAGGNHVLPTGGAARYASPLGVYDFRKRTSWIEYSAAAALAHSAPIATLAACEGLDGHGRSAELRGRALVGAAPDDPDPLGGLATRVPPALRRHSAYHVPVPPELRAKLDANELPYGLPAELRGDLARELATVALERYPDPAAGRLRAAVARRLAVAPEQLVFGNGSDELISLICCALPGPVLYPTPTFVYYRLAALARGLPTVEVPLASEFQLDEDAVERAVVSERPTVVFLALPNNPTGTLWRPQFALELAARHRDVAIVSDEAYFAYSGASNLPALADHPNLIIMRTLSKIGMAGLRVGMTISSPAVANLLDKVRPPYNISALDQRAAAFLLERDDAVAWSAASAAAVIAERERMAVAFAARGLVAMPSAANLLLVRVADAPAAHRRLAAAGVSVRAFGPGALADFLRVTIGTPSENDLALALLVGSGG